MLFRSLSLPPQVTPIVDPDLLDCSETVVSGAADDGYVDPAANDENANLTQDELINLAAADVQDLAPPRGGSVGSSWLGLALTVLLLVLSGVLVRWRSRLMPDEPDPDAADGESPDPAPADQTHPSDPTEETTA